MVFLTGYPRKQALKQFQGGVNFRTPTLSSPESSRPDHSNPPCKILVLPSSISQNSGTPPANVEWEDRSRLPAVWAYRTHKAVFGVERTLLVTFNQRLFRAQTNTLSQEIHKRQRKLEELENRLRRRRPDDRGMKPTLAGEQKKVRDFSWSAYGRLIPHSDPGNRQCLSHFEFQFRTAAYRDLCSTLLEKTILFTDHGED
jgi:hypothetical protein